MILSGHDLQWYIERGELRIQGAAPDQFQQNGVDLVLDDVEDRPLGFVKGNFYLGNLRERVTMPNDLMAFVQLRSTWARRGIIIPPTVIDAGFEGDITVEIAAFAQIPVPYGQRFAHVVFAKLTSPSAPYRGKYQGQRGVTRAIDD